MLKSLVLRAIYLLQNRKFAYAFAGALTVFVTAVAWGSSSWMSASNSALLFVAGIVFVGLQAGVGPAVLTAVLCFFCFNFFLTQPLYTFRIDSQDDILTLVLMTSFGLLLAPVSAILREHLLMSESLQKAKLATEMEQLKNALLSSVSHDLRSPLSAMSNAAEVLIERRSYLTSEDQGELLTTLSQEAKRLDKYIQNLLDMTKLGYGSLKLNRDWVTTSELIDTVLNRIQRDYPQVPFECLLHDHDALLYVHGALIEQSLYNVIENACRFSPSGTPVTIKTYEHEANFVIAIEDRGPGVAKAIEDNLFEMFHQIQGKHQSSANLGMGLSISQGMVRAHGGEILLDKTHKHGARFIISLPFDKGRSRL